MHRIPQPPSFLPQAARSRLRDPFASYKIRTDPSSGSCPTLPPRPSPFSISGTSILNTPTVSQTLSVPGTTFVLDCQPIRTCDRWMVLIAGYTSGKVPVGDFGNSPNNSPAFSEMTVFGQPSDLVTFLMAITGAWSIPAFYGNELVRYDLGTDITLPTPTLLGGDDSAVSIRRVSVQRASVMSGIFPYSISVTPDTFHERQSHLPLPHFHIAGLRTDGCDITTPAFRPSKLTAWG